MCVYTCVQRECVHMHVYALSMLFEADPSNTLKAVTLPSLGDP